MKTTFELPDELLREVNAVAVRRQTSLEAIVEHALRREIAAGNGITEPGAGFFSLDEHGFPVMRKSGPTRVTSETVRRLREDE